MKRITVGDIVSLRCGGTNRVGEARAIQLGMGRRVPMLDCG